MYKYRIIKKPSEPMYIVQYKPIGLINILLDWTEIATRGSMFEAQQFCLDSIQNNKAFCEKFTILEVFKP